MADASILQAVRDANNLAGLGGKLIASFLWDAGRWCGHIRREFAYTEEALGSLTGF